MAFFIEIIAVFNFTNKLTRLSDIPGNELASKIWIKLFSSLWSSLQEFTRAALTAEMIPFLSSGCHLLEKDQPHSAVATFLEAFYRCQPPIPIHPNVLMVYLYDLEENFKN